MAGMGGGHEGCAATAAARVNRILLRRDEWLRPARIFRHDRSKQWHGGGNGSSGYSAGASGGRVNPIVSTIHPIVRNPIVNTIHPILATSTVVRDHRGPCGAPSGGVTVSTTGGARHSGANGYRGPGGIHCNP